jgi:hypothetical protein
MIISSSSSRIDPEKPSRTGNLRITYRFADGWACAYLDNGVGWVYWTPAGKNADGAKHARRHAVMQSEIRRWHTHTG